MRKRDTRLKFENAMHTLSTNKFQLSQPLQLEATWWHEEFVNSLPVRNHQGFWFGKIKQEAQVTSEQQTSDKQTAKKR